MDVVPVIINCLLAGKLIKSYEMGYAETLGPTVPPSDESFINEAKTALTTDGLARPTLAFNSKWFVAARASLGPVVSSARYAEPDESQARGIHDDFDFFEGAEGIPEPEIHCKRWLITAVRPFRAI